MKSILWRQFPKLVETEYRSVLADEFVAYVASSAFSDSALHAHFHSREDLAVLESELLQCVEREVNQNRRSAHDYCHARIRIALRDVRRNESHVSVPVVLRAVDCKIYRAVRLLHPDVLHLIQAHSSLAVSTAGRG